MDKLTKENGLVHRSMYQAIIHEEYEWEECKESLHQRLGPTMVSDLVELGSENTPQYDPHEDKLQNAKTFPILDEVPEVTL